MMKDKLQVFPLQLVHSEALVIFNFDQTLTGESQSFNSETNLIGITFQLLKGTC